MRLIEIGQKFNRILVINIKKQELIKSLKENEYPILIEQKIAAKIKLLLKKPEIIQFISNLDKKISLAIAKS